MTSAPNNNGPGPRKRGAGAPKGNENAKTHGIHSARRALNEFGLRAIDGRSAVGVALRQFRASLVDDLGGEDALSTQQRAVIDVVVREKLMLDSIDAYVLDLPSLVHRRKRAILPVVRERSSIASSFVQHLQLLGLERKARPAPTLAEYLASRSGPTEDASSEPAPETPRESGNAQPAASSQDTDGVGETEETTIPAPVEPVPDPVTEFHWRCRCCGETWSTTIDDPGACAVCTSDGDMIQPAPTPAKEVQSD